MVHGHKATELQILDEVQSPSSKEGATLRTNGHLSAGMDESPVHPSSLMTRAQAPTKAQERVQAQRMQWRAVAQAVALITAWYAMSTALNIYNKKVIGHKYGVLGGEPFPLPMLMSAVQFALQHFLARGVHVLGVRRQLHEPRSWEAWRRTVLPNGVATGLDIAFSNASYAFITLSFYTMCKSSSPLFLLLFAFLWGIEKPSWSLAGTISIISMGLLMLVAGEVEFDIRGFLLVITAACMSGLRWTITQVLLQGDGDGGGHTVARGTALEVMESVTPVMAVTSGVLSLLVEPVSSALRTSTYFASWEHVGITFLLMLLSAVLAFVMVWTEFALIATTSALTFMVAGVFKEIVTVIVAHFTFGDKFTEINTLGLAVLIFGVCLFNYQKYRKLQDVSRRHAKEEPAVAATEAAVPADEAALLPAQ